MRQRASASGAEMKGEWLVGSETTPSQGNAATMRQHFSRVRAISPQGYRQSFSRSADRSA